MTAMRSREGGIAGQIAKRLVIWRSRRAVGYAFAVSICIPSSAPARALLMNSGNTLIGVGYANEGGGKWTALFR